MMIYSVDTGEIVFNRGGVVGTKLVENAGNEYVHLMIEPGGSIPDHALPIAVDFFVAGGTGTASVDGVTLEVAAGQMISCPPNSSRGWKNGGTEKLEVLVIKAVGKGT